MRGNGLSTLSRESSRLLERAGELLGREGKTLLGRLELELRAEHAELMDEFKAELARVREIKAVPGPAGPAGKAGQDGKDGKDGIPGRDGLPGLPGRDGAPGAAGAPGKDGAPGEKGLDGAAYHRLNELHKGVWKPGGYMDGDWVTANGSIWRALRNTTDQAEHR